MRSSALFRSALVALLLVALPGLASADDLLDQANSLMTSGDAKSAYALLAPHESERAGNPDYDYLLGIAALDSGQPAEAVFALERVLAVNPNHAQARAELGRAYFELRELDRSKRELEAVRKEGPPPAAQATIQRYLDAIQRIQTPETTKVTGYLSLTLGHDSNVNSATSERAVALSTPFGAFTATLDATARKSSANFGRVTAGASVKHALSDRLTLLANGAVNQRWNAGDNSRFDTGGVNADVALALSQGEDTYTVGLQGERFTLDRNTYRDAYALVGQWQRNLDRNNQVSAYAQITRLDYANTDTSPANDQRNANRYVAGAAYARALGGDWAPVVYAGAYVGKENALASGVDYLSNKLYGLRLGAQARANAKTLIFGAASAEHRNYDGTTPLFLVSRRDNYYDLRAGVRYVPARGWSVTPQISYSRNNSNVSVSDYNRTMVYVTLRRDFQ